MPLVRPLFDSDTSSLLSLRLLAESLRTANIWFRRLLVVAARRLFHQDFRGIESSAFDRSAWLSSETDLELILLLPTDIPSSDDDAAAADFKILSVNCSTAFWCKNAPRPPFDFFFKGDDDDDKEEEMVFLFVTRGVVLALRGLMVVLLLVGVNDAVNNEGMFRSPCTTVFFVALDGVPGFRLVGDARSPPILTFFLGDDDDFGVFFDLGVLDDDAPLAEEWLLSESTLLLLSVVEDDIFLTSFFFVFGVDDDGDSNFFFDVDDDDDDDALRGDDEWSLLPSTFFRLLLLLLVVLVLLLREDEWSLVSVRFFFFDALRGDNTLSVLLLVRDDEWSLPGLILRLDCFGVDVLPLVLCELPSFLLLLVLPVGIAVADRFVVVVVVGETFGFIFGDAKIDVDVVVVADDRDEEVVDDVAMVDFDLNESHSENVDDGFEETNTSGRATTTSTFS
mmetsp:Transcript_52768/g.127920  ORF Transcript_52768/g.127920 Transcript_52768/m.127920 type:complete len:450 (+) Transcript_52768:911-2260(+)